jgi:hypothetical protein
MGVQTATGAIVVDGIAPLKFRFSVRSHSFWNTFPFAWRKDALTDWLWGNLNLVLSRRSKSNRTI